MAVHPSHGTSHGSPALQVPFLLPAGEPLAMCTPAEWGLVSLGRSAVVDLPGQFFDLSEIGECLAVWPEKLTRWPRYTDTGDNGGGLDNHFQGFQRLRTPGYCVVTGGDPHEPVSNLFIVRMGSRGTSAIWGSNLKDGPLPPREDRCVARLDIDSTFWHAGGMAQLGDVLAIPLENSDGAGSRVEFIEVREPTRPTVLGCAIDRPGVKGGAVALTRLDDGRFVAAVWSDSESRKPEKHMDLYISESTSLLGAQWHGPFCHTTAIEAIPKFQTICFLRDRDENGSATDLYMLGFENEAEIAPKPKGPHHGILYHVTLPAEVGGTGDRLEFQQVASPKNFQCTADFADMDAATGVYVSPSGVLAVYCAHHFTRRGPHNKFLIRFQEFYSTGPGSADASVNSLSDSRIELFDSPGLAGEPLTLIGDRAAVDDFEAIFINGKPFSKRVSSVRCRLAKGFAFVLYRDRRRKGGGALAIEGRGSPVVIERLADHGFDDTARSCGVVATNIARNLKDITWIAE